MESLATGEFTQWLSSHSQWLGPVIFAIALVESLAIAGLLVPGVVLLFAASALAGSGDMSLISTMTWAFTGAVCGDMLSFALGRYFHQDIRRLPLFRRNPQWIDRGESFFRHFGTLSILIGRFVGPIRPVIPMVAGMFDMPLMRFTLVNVASALAWAPAYVLPGFAAGQASNWQVPEHFWSQTLGLSVGLAGLGLAILLLLKSQQRWSCLVAGGLCLLALLGLGLADPWLNVFDTTLSNWLLQLNREAPPMLREALLPLNGGLFLLLLAGPPLLLLLAGGYWRQLLFMLLTLLLSVALGLLPGIPLSATLLASKMAVLLGILMICNREQSFWLRASWMLYLPPAATLLITATIYQAVLPPPAIISAMLQAGAAGLLSIWLLDRGAPMAMLVRPMRYLLPLWPAIAGALLAVTNG